MFPVLVVAAGMIEVGTCTRKVGSQVSSADVAFGEIHMFLRGQVSVYKRLRTSEALTRCRPVCLLRRIASLVVLCRNS